MNSRQNGNWVSNTKAMDKGKRIEYQHSINPRTAAGAAAMLIQNAPAIVARGKELISKAGAIKVAEMERTGGRVKGGFVRGFEQKTAQAPGGNPAPANLPPAASTESQNRTSAPTALSMSFDGPTYEFGPCSYQGMTGLRITMSNLFASVEQNTTIALRGLLRSINLAGLGGDNSMIASVLNPCSQFISSTTVGRISNIGTLLYAFASPFRKYRWKRFGVKFESELPTTQPGGLCMGFTSDPADSVLAFASPATTLAQFPCSLFTSLWDNAYLDCTPALDKTLKNMIPSGMPVTSLAYQNCSPGSFFVASDGQLTTNLVVGKLIAYYEIELYSPGPIPTSFAATTFKESIKHEAAEAKSKEVYDIANRTLEENEKESEKEVLNLEEEYLKISEPTKESAGYKKLGGFLSL